MKSKASQIEPTGEIQNNNNLIKSIKFKYNNKKKSILLNIVLTHSYNMYNNIKKNLNYKIKNCENLLLQNFYFIKQIVNKIYLNYFF